jgi:hypothetical protein
MSATVCAREREVIDLVAVGQWPAQADASLRSHVGACATCAEVASVAMLLHDVAEHAPVPKLPDASVVWYRAQVRAREEAVRRATRPMNVVAAAAAAVVLVGLWWVVPQVWDVPALVRATGQSVSAAWLTTGSGTLKWVGLGAAGAAAVWAVAGSLAWALTAAED